MITLKQSGDWAGTRNFLRQIRLNKELNILDKYGKIGVEQLRNATPVDTGLTAASWYYEIIKDDEGFKLQFCNSNVNNFVQVAVILQFGHATKNGTWVEGVDYINPVLQPIFEELSDKVWKEVSRV